MQILVYLLILTAKIIEVSMATMRIVLITRGERLRGAIIGFFEVLLWIFLVSSVLKDISEDPIKVIVYAAGFAIGNYLGSIFEQKLGVGVVRIEAIVLQEHGDTLANRIREMGYAVTVVEGHGMNFKRHVLLMSIRRKDTDKVTKMIRSLQENVVITINDIKPVYGGFGVLKR